MLHFKELSGQMQTQTGFFWDTDESIYVAKN